MGGTPPSFVRWRSPRRAESRTASPIAVPSPMRSVASAGLTNSRSVVGADTTCARELKSTTATRYFPAGPRGTGGPRPAAAASRDRGHVGRAHRSRRVDREHDRRLLGAHRDVRVRPCEADEERRDGQQEQRDREVSAPRRHPIHDVGAQRRRDELRRTRARVVARAGRSRSQCGHEQQGPQGERRREAHCAPAWRRKPVSSRSQSPSVESTTWRAPAEMSSAATSARSCAAAAANRCAQPTARRVDLELAAGLGIDQPQLPELRQLLLSRVADLDRDDVVASAEREQRPAPVAGAAEVGDDDDERPLTRQSCRRAGAPRRPRSRRPRPRARPPPPPAAPRAGRADRPVPAAPAACAGVRRRRSRARGDCRAASRRTRSRARRPRRRRPCGARPCRTSSTARCRATSQVTSARSARWIRTCGSPRARRHVPVDLAHVVLDRLVRADLRELASRARAGTSGDRPGSRPSTRRAIVRSRARSSGSGIGPGPGRAGVCPRRRMPSITPLLPREVELWHRDGATITARACCRGCAPRRAPRRRAPAGGAARPCMSSCRSSTST